MNARLPFGAPQLLRLLAPATAESIAGDLVEEAALRAATDGERRARAWLRRELAASILPLARRRFRAGAFPVGAGVASAMVALTSLGALWRYVLSLVPLRAQHAPPLPLLAAAIVSAGCAAWCGFLLGRALDGGSRSSREMR